MGIEQQNENLSPDDKLEELGCKLTQKYGDVDGDGYSYKVEYAEKLDNGEPNLDSQMYYKAEFMGETFEIGLESPEQMINILKLTDYILTLYKKSGYSIKNGDNFYAKEGFMSGESGVGEKIDLYINNRPTDILDTVYLSQEKLLKLLIDKGEDFTNNFITEYATFLNKVLEKTETEFYIGDIEEGKNEGNYKTGDKQIENIPIYTELNSGNYKTGDKYIELKKEEK